MRAASGLRREIVAGFSRIGLSEIDLGDDGVTDDKASGGPFGAAIDVAPAVNPAKLDDRREPS